MLSRVSGLSALTRDVKQLVKVARCEVICYEYATSMSQVCYECDTIVLRGYARIEVTPVR